MESVTMPLRVYAPSGRGVAYARKTPLDIIRCEQHGLCAPPERIPAGRIRAPPVGTREAMLLWESPPRRVLLVKKWRDTEAMVAATEIADWVVDAFGVTICVWQDPADDDASSAFPPRYPRFDPASHSEDDIDVIITVGGDGTVLHVASLFQSSVPPVIAIAFGSLGFMTVHSLSSCQGVLTRVFGGAATASAATNTPAAAPSTGRAVNASQQFSLSSVSLAAAAAGASDVVSAERTAAAAAAAVTEDSGSSDASEPRAPLPSAPSAISLSSDATTVTVAASASPPSSAAAAAATGASAAAAPSEPVPVSLRMRLRVDVFRRGTPPGAPPLLSRVVLNELLLERGPSPYMATLNASVNGEPLTTVAADGLIVATQTGSTAYSLSAGGSILSPDTASIVFTPICPHTLSFRPLLFPDSVVLRLEVPPGARACAWASFDGRDSMQLEAGDFVSVASSPWPLPLVCRGTALSDWIRAIKFKLYWNVREKQHAFKRPPPAPAAAAGGVMTTTTAASSISSTAATVLLLPAAESSSPTFTAAAATATFQATNGAALPLPLPQSDAASRPASSSTAAGSATGRSSLTSTPERAPYSASSRTATVPLPPAAAAATNSNTTTGAAASLLERYAAAAAPPHQRLPATAAVSAHSYDGGGSSEFAYGGGGGNGNGGGFASAPGSPSRQPRLLQRHHQHQPEPCDNIQGPRQQFQQATQQQSRRLSVDSAGSVDSNAAARRLAAVLSADEPRCGNSGSGGGDNALADCSPLVGVVTVGGSAPHYDDDEDGDGVSDRDDTPSLAGAIERDEGGDCDDGDGGGNEIQLVAASAGVDSTPTLRADYSDAAKSSNSSGGGDVESTAVVNVSARSQHRQASSASANGPSGGWEGASSPSAAISVAPSHASAAAMAGTMPGATDVGVYSGNNCSSSDGGSPRYFIPRANFALKPTTASASAAASFPAAALKTYAPG